MGLGRGRSGWRGMGIPKDLLRNYKGLSEWCILRCYRGSITHGTYRPSSEPSSIDDKDALAICVPPIDYYFGLEGYGSRGTKEIKRNEWDIVIYEAKKAISLLAKGNPNALSMLWLNPKHYMYVSDAGQLILDNRDLFSARHVYRSFTGYAYSQLKRMEHFSFQGYMGEKRKRLVEEHGFDTKNAAHLIRLLRMGLEFLKEGRLYVERHDAKQLLAIKRGEWSLDRVKAEADRLFALVDEAYLQCSLPEEPDNDKINDLAIAVIWTALRDRTAQLTFRGARSVRSGSINR